MQVKDLQGSLKEIEASVDQCQQEIVELKRENEMLCMEADSLKKVTVCVCVSHMHVHYII